MKSKKLYALMIHVLIMIVICSPIWSQYPDDTEEELDVIIDTEDNADLQPILKTATEYRELKTFLDLLKESGISKELKSKEPYTLFAPDDSAFKKLGSTELQRLKADKQFLKNVLAMHIVPGKKISFGIDSETISFKSLYGAEITAHISEEGVQIDKAWIIDEEIDCSNGVLHVIDVVLLPKKEKTND